MQNPFTLGGKTILVTGASSGIGRGIAIACAGMGARVILTARNQVRLQETLSLLEGDGHIIIPADLTDDAQRHALVEQVSSLDGFVQCAGVMNRIPGKSIGKEDIDSVFLPNVEAPMLLQAELLQVRKINKEASIVYIASIAARSAVAGNALYSASKAALISYAKCLALELAPRKIRVNCICPAMVWTDLALVGATKEELEADQLKYPLKRYGTPEDIANLAIYLLSDASCWMTGSCVEITGGGIENELVMNVYIKDIAYYLPEKVLNNEQLAAEFPEWSTEKIAGKVGIAERHIAALDETASDMAFAAAERLLAKGHDRSQIDFVLLCTQSPDYMLPSSACIVQHRLGLSTQCGAFDFNLGCSGYEYGLVMAKSLIQSGVAHNVLLLTSELYTKYLSQDDKGNRTIFSDGASATWIGTDGFAEIGECSLGTDGSGAEFLIKRPNEPLYMDGGAIFDFSSDVVPKMVEDVLHKSNLQMDDVNLWVFHQANKYMINYIRKMLEIDKERFYIYMEHVGNTVSSTIPIALCAARDEGKLHGNVMLAGFGVGLSWGAVMLKCKL